MFSDYTHIDNIENWIIHQSIITILDWTIVVTSHYSKCWFFLKNLLFHLWDYKKHGKCRVDVSVMIWSLI